MDLINRQRLALVITLVTLALLLLAAGPLLVPAAIALIMALLLSPLHGLLSTVVPSKAMSALIITAIGCIAALLVIFGVVPFIIADAGALVQKLIDNAQALGDRFNRLFHFWWPHAAPLGEQIKEQLSNGAPLPGSLMPALGQVAALGNAIVGGIFALFLIPLLLFFFLKDGARFQTWLINLLPRRFQADASDLLGAVSRGLSGYVRGQSLVCASQAVFHAAGLMILGVQFGLLIGLLTGLSAVIPIIGNAIMLTLALLVAMIQTDGWTLVILVAALYAAAQLIETVVLVPTLVGTQIRAHPLVVIGAVLIGGRLFGLIGALLALPATSALSATAWWLWARYRQSSVYRINRPRQSEAAH